jgi:uncharacterized protein YndB with AHSA1/START domain
MPREFNLEFETTVEATPEEVWAAIATGPGVDSWFMGRTEFEGDTLRQEMLGETSQATVTAWEPGKHLQYSGTPEADGRFMAFEYLLEGRGGGSTVIRLVHSGFLGDDWEAEYDALKQGDLLYLRKLAAYLKRFPGRVSSHNLFLVGPQVPDRERVWAAFKDVLGVTGPLEEGASARLSLPGLPPATGVVEFAGPAGVVVSAGDSMHTLVYGMGTVVVEQHSFAPDAAPETIETAWKDWLAAAFA